MYAYTERKNVKNSDKTYINKIFNCLKKKYIIDILKMPLDIIIKVLGINLSIKI